VLGHDREQVREQLVLERRQVVRDRDGAVVGAFRAVDGAVRGDGDGRLGVGLGGAAGDDGRRGTAGFGAGRGDDGRRRARAAAGRRVFAGRSPRDIPCRRATDGLGADLLGRGLLAPAVQAAASVISLLVRYRRPSSSRRW
jgi:hypothetical protein